MFETGEATNVVTQNHKGNSTEAIKSAEAVRVGLVVAWRNGKRAVATADRIATSHHK